MKIAKTTPWYLEPGTDNVIGKNLRLIHATQEYKGHTETDENVIAEARLIAAAPDLLSAIKRLLEIHDDEAEEYAINAISKAEGK